MRSATTSVSGLSGRLRSFSPETACLARLLFNARTQSLAESLGVSLAPSTGTGGHLSHALRFCAGNNEIRVAFEAQSIPAFAIAATTPEPPVRNALASLLLDAPLATLSRFAGQTVELTSFSAIENNRNHASGLAVLVGNVMERTTSHVVVEADGDLRSLEYRLNTSAPNAVSGIPPLSIPGRVVAGVKRYRPQFLRTIRPGDVLVNCFQSGATPDELPNVNVFWGAPRGRQMQTRGHLKNRSITLEDLPTMTVDTDQSTPGQADIDHTLPSAMLDLELPVQLELDSLALPLGKLCDLRPGHVLELPVPVADTQIRLVSYGQILGFGKLVAVGESLGLQITRMTEPGFAATRQRDGEANAHAAGFDDHESNT